MTASSSAKKYFQLEASHTPRLNVLIQRVVSPEFTGSSEQFFGLQDVFEDFVASDELLAIINHELSVMRSSPEYVPRGSNGNTILLFDAPMVTLTAIVLDKNNTSMEKIYSAAGDAIFGNVSADPIPFRFHEIPASCDLDIFDTSQSVIAGPRFDLAPKKTVTIPARKVVTEYLATSQTTLVKLTSRFYHPLIWVYDKATGSPRFSSSGNLQASRLQSTISLLSALEAETAPTSNESMSNLMKLSEHRFHFVRWSAVQALCKLDFSVGKEVLAQATDDPHPHISRAARHSVEKLRSTGIQI